MDEKPEAEETVISKRVTSDDVGEQTMTAAKAEEGDEEEGEESEAPEEEGANEGDAEGAEGAGS